MINNLGWLGCFLTICFINSASSSSSCSSFPPNAPSGSFSLQVQGGAKGFSPSQSYSIILESSHPFTEFILTCDGKLGGGSFQIPGGSSAIFSEHCVSTVTNADKWPKNRIHVVWTAPFGACVDFRAAIRIKHEWRSINKTLCSIKSGSEGTISTTCCACDHAKYKVIFEGLWSPETHPRDFPETLWLTHFSDVIGASHSSDFKLWGEGQVASYGFKQLAEFGVIRELETELRNVSYRLRTIIKAAGLWHPHLNENTTAVFRVDPRRHLLSLASMFGPSPDWVVGVSSLNLCTTDCKWIEHQVIDLYPYDAGTDDGITYMSVNSPTEPQEKIRRITTMYPEDPRSPFYDPSLKEMKPLAKLYIFKEKDIPKSCSDLTEADLMEQVLLAENTEEEQRVECVVSEYSEWSSCSVSCGKGLRMRSRSYLDPQQAALSNCDRQLVSREMCVSPMPLCPGEEEEELVEGLAGPGECDVSAWSEWSDCSVSCGIGFLLRTRVFLNGTVASHKKCMHIPTMEKEKCMQPLCSHSDAPQTSQVEECPVSDWSEWSPCSVTCGSRGMRTRVRRLLGHETPLCQALLPLRENRPCRALASCLLQPAHSKDVCSLEAMKGPCRGKFKKWAYNPLVSSCEPFSYGGCRGNRNNFRTEEECMAACSPHHGTLPEEVQKVKESRQEKPVNCVVSKWTPWSDCLPCPTGQRTKTRSVVVRAENGGRPCPELFKSVKCSIPEEFCSNQ